MAGEITNGGFVAIRSNRSPCDRVEQGAVPDDDVVDPVEGGVEPRDAQRPGVDVGGDDRCRCGRRGAAPARRSRCPGRASVPTGSRMVSCASDVEAGLTPSTWSAPTRFGLPSRPGVRSLTTQRSRPPAAYGRMSRSAPTSPTVCSRMPSADSSFDQAGERALARPRSGTGAWSRNSRTSVSTALPPAVRRSPGTVSLRASASWACRPAPRPRRRT